MFHPPRGTQHKYAREPAIAATPERTAADRPVALMQDNFGNQVVNGALANDGGLAAVIASEVLLDVSGVPALDSSGLASNTAMQEALHTASSDAPVLRAAAGPRVVDRPAAETLIRASRGAPLPPAVAVRMGAVLGHDFGHVRVHTDRAAARAAEALNAHAFALGAHVFFADGAFAPGSPAGDERILHELTHVVQHDDGRLPSTGGVSRPTDAAEREATQTAAALLPRLDPAPEAEAPVASAAPLDLTAVVERDRDSADETLPDVRRPQRLTSSEAETQAALDELVAIATLRQDELVMLADGQADALRADLQSRLGVVGEQASAAGERVGGLVDAVTSRVREAHQQAVAGVQTFAKRERSDLKSELLTVDALATDIGSRRDAGVGATAERVQAACEQALAALTAAMPRLWGDLASMLTGVVEARRGDVRTTAAQALPDTTQAHAAMVAEAEADLADRALADLGNSPSQALFTMLTNFDAAGFAQSRAEAPAARVAGALDALDGAVTPLRESLPELLDACAARATEALEIAGSSADNALTQARPEAVQGAQEAGDAFLDALRTDGEALATGMQQQARLAASAYADIVAGLVDLDPVTGEAIAGARSAVDERHAADLDRLQQDPALDQVVAGHRAAFETSLAGQTEGAEELRVEYERLFGEACAGWEATFRTLADANLGHLRRRRDDAERVITAVEASLTGVDADPEAIATEQEAALLSYMKQAWGPAILARAAELAPPLVEKNEAAIRIGHAGSLRAAMDGLGTGSQVFDVLRQQSPAGMEYLKVAYGERYAHRAPAGQSPLYLDLEDELSRDALAAAVAYLDHRRVNALQAELRDADGFFNEQERRMIAVLEAASDEEIMALRDGGGLDEVFSELGGDDLGQVQALIEVGDDGELLPRADRLLAARAIELYEAMDHLGTSEQVVYRILKEAGASAEDRKKLRTAYASWSGDELDDDLASEFSFGEETWALGLAAEDRTDTDMLVIEALEAASLWGTREEAVFKALLDPRLKRGEVDDSFRRLSDHASLEAFMDAEMGGFGANTAFVLAPLPTLTWEEVVTKRMKNGHPVTASLLRPPLLDMERIVADQIVARGRADKHVLLKWAVVELGTKLDVILQVLSNQGAPLPRSAVNSVLRNYEALWLTAAATVDFEKQALANETDRAEIEKLAANSGGPPGDLSSDLSGDDWVRVRELLFGQPETPAEAYYIARVRYEHEGNILSELLTIAANAYVQAYSRDELSLSDTGQDRDASAQRAGQAYDALDADLRDQPWEVIIGRAAEDAQVLKWACAYLREDAKAYGAFQASVVDAFVTTLQVIGGAILTAFTAGLASPVLLAIISNLVVTGVGIAVKATLMQSKYWDDIGTDALKGLVAALAAGATVGIDKVLKLGERVATTFVGKAAKEAIEKVGGQWSAEGLELSIRGRALLYDIVQTVVDEGLKTVAETGLSAVVDPAVLDHPVAALWGEDSLGIQILQSLPGSVAKSVVDAADIVGWLKERGVSDEIRATLGKAFAETLGDSAWDVVTELQNLPDYADAPELWNKVLSQSLKNGAKQLVKAIAKYAARGRLIEGAVRGEVDAERLERAAVLTDEDRIAIARGMIDAGLRDRVPQSFIDLLATVDLLASLPVLEPAAPAPPAPPAAPAPSRSHEEPPPTPDPAPAKVDRRPREIPPAPPLAPLPGKAE